MCRRVNHDALAAPPDHQTGKQPLQVGGRQNYAVGRDWLALIPRTPGRPETYIKTLPDAELWAPEGQPVSGLISNRIGHTGKEVELRHAFCDMLY